MAGKGNKVTQGGHRESGPSTSEPTPTPSPNGRRPSQMDGPAEQQSRHPNPFGQGMGYDPAKPVKKESLIANGRVDLPQAAYALDYDALFKSEMPGRPGLNDAKDATGIIIRVNQFKVMAYPQKDIYQYDILIGDGGLVKPGLIKAIWMSRAVQAEIKTISHFWVWNGDKIAWCDAAWPRKEARIKVDLDAERGRPPRPNGPSNVHYVVIRQVKIIRMAVLNAYLTRRMSFDNSIFEAVNFLDHLMRHMPDAYYTAIKRSYFSRGNVRSPLDTVVEAMKGVYSSLRLCDASPSIGPGTGLALNVDVANGTFWASQDVHQAARNLCKARNPRQDFQVFKQNLLPVKAGQLWTQSTDMKELRKMAKLKFTVKHRGKAESEKTYTIKGFTFPKEINSTYDPKLKFREEGLHSKNYYFNQRGPNGTSKSITIYDYFLSKYNIRLLHPHLPLIETEKAGQFPMEVCTLVPNQQYKFKLDPAQTASMIKFAVTKPKDRLLSIQHGIGMLKWNEDTYLKHYGLKIDPNLSMTKARLLKNPEIQFGAAKLNPSTTGRWDLRGKRFFRPNDEPLKSWGICIMEGCTQPPVVENFLKVFVQTYIGHGGKVETKQPLIFQHERSHGDLGNMANLFRNAVGAKYNLVPQILLFVMGRRDSEQYERLKKNMECRFATVSQMMNVAHVQRAQPQYCSNVCMKLNAKLGGTTSKVACPEFSLFNKRTMIIGADVSHASPGSLQASMAAMTMSMDKECCRYAAAVQTNGHRVEMITEHNIRNMLIPLIDHWVAKVNGGQGGPAHIYYFRDGVSEAQYQHVLDQEVAHMRKAMKEKYGAGADSVKWTVTVVSKRHHIRFFPKEGDRISADKNNNALPGTLVERDVTHPFEYDFYLCAHSAIQGTARPVHYHVIKDDAKVAPAAFHKMIYQMSYQYMRSTTPVSLIPAVYYAHLASNRARAHEDRSASEGPRGGQKFVEAQNDAVFRGEQPTSHTGSSQQLTEAKPLVPLGAPQNGPAALAKIRNGMWYI